MNEIGVEIGDDHVATVELRRPPNNTLDMDLVRQLADALHELDGDRRVRATVLAAAGKHFCGGIDLGKRIADTTAGVEVPEFNPLYAQAVRLCEVVKPVVVAVQGAAVGGGFGMTMVFDFRVACPEARFAPNFAQLGTHHGFGLSVTLPAVVGIQKAQELLYLGKRIDGMRAFELGLCDRLVPLDRLRAEAHSFAAEIASSAPLAVQAIRSTLRRGLAAQVKAATDHEHREQTRMRATSDNVEGMRAMSERRAPVFTGT
ncbi:MAG: enoyl-CoA hydratase/isomerase family protein [Acidimicrobiia bacterium]